MARGKHGLSAAARKAVSDGEQQIGAYQHTVQRLTAEVAALKQQAAAAQEAHTKAVRTLQAQRDEGLSPMLTVLQQENVTLKDRADRAERQYRELHGKWEQATDRLHGHFTNAHGLSGLAAMEECLKLIGADGKRIAGGLVGEEKLLKTSGGLDAVDAVRRARGGRR